MTDLPTNRQTDIRVHREVNVSRFSNLVHKVQGVQENLCFFTIHCNPSLVYIVVRDLQSSQRNASVQSLQFFLQPRAAEG